MKVRESVEFTRREPIKKGETFILTAVPVVLFRGRWLETDRGVGIRVVDVITAAGKPNDRHRSLTAEEGWLPILRQPPKPIAAYSKAMRPEGIPFATTTPPMVIQIVLISDWDLAFYSCRMEGYAVR